jgi:hypothetical protein
VLTWVQAKDAGPDYVLQQLPPAQTELRPSEDEAANQVRLVKSAVRDTPSFPCP